MSIERLSSECPGLGMRRLYSTGGVFAEVAKARGMSGLRFARALFSALALALVLVPRVAFADDIAAYDTFVKGATSQPGLFTLWHKAGKLYIELSAGQLDHDFVQTIVPSSGLGGNFVVWGNTDHLPTELVRFERAGTNVAILWP
ncbi:MAG: DUF5118 domain-containing protein, partial [Candidatus Eremiobacteraeota bacterium]|nr:DUF5118 domain-containing protein [Candidatus Eremiobacteraeota bacterium]